jgi:hypothetical protein
LLSCSFGNALNFAILLRIAGNDSISIAVFDTFQDDSVNFLKRHNPTYNSLYILHAYYILYVYFFMPILPCNDQKLARSAYNFSAYIFHVYFLQKRDDDQ